MKPLILSKHLEIVDFLEQAETAHSFVQGGEFVLGSYFISVLSQVPYSRNRCVYDCIAIKMQ